MTLNSFVPPIVRNILMIIRRPFLGFTGPIDSWSKGLREGFGYDNPKLSVKFTPPNFFEQPNSNYISDRESRLGFALSKVLMQLKDHDKIRVQDFGGANGAHYKLAKIISEHLNFQWGIVEVAAQVEAYSPYANHEVSWSTNIESLPRQVSIASGALQYAENAEEILENFQEFSDFILLDRLSTNPGPSHILMKQNFWSAKTGRVSYPCWYFSRDALIEKLSRTHSVISAWDVPEDSPWVFGARRPNVGLLLQRKRL